MEGPIANPEALEQRNLDAVAKEGQLDSNNTGNENTTVMVPLKLSVDRRN